MLITYVAAIMIIMVLSYNVSLQSNPVYMDTKEAIESVGIKGMSVLSGLNLEKIIRTLFPLGQSKLRVQRKSVLQPAIWARCG